MCVLVVAGSFTDVSPGTTWYAASGEATGFAAGVAGFGGGVADGAGGF